MESTWNRHGFHMDSTWYLFYRKDKSEPAIIIILITFFPKYALFVMQEIVGNQWYTPTIPGHTSPKESSNISKITT
jgi:hypothetical protein